MRKVGQAQVVREQDNNEVVVYFHAIKIKRLLQWKLFFLKKPPNLVDWVTE